MALDKGGHVFEAEQGFIKIGNFQATDHACPVIGVIDHANAEVDVFLWCTGDQLAQIHFIEEVGGGVIVEAVAGHGDDRLA